MNKYMFTFSLDLQWPSCSHTTLLHLLLISLNLKVMHYFTKRNLIT